MAIKLSVGRTICDFAVLIALALPLLIFHEFVQPFKRGFYCDDESIRYPYKPDTVTRQMLIVIGILTPASLILFTEVFRTLAWERKNKQLFRSYELSDRHVHRLVVRLYTFLGYFFVGVCFNQLMVDIAKYTIGRQRPHFMDACKPQPGWKDCLNDHQYITDFTCQSKDKWMVIESQLSFYSGHSAFSFYAATYTTFYLQARLYRPLISRLVLPVIQFALYGGAAFVAYSRISDYMHHWSDVLVGAIIGTSIGILNAVCIANVFQRREIPAGIKHERRFQMDGGHHDAAIEPAHSAEHANNVVDVERGSNSKTPSHVTNVPIELLTPTTIIGPTIVRQTNAPLPATVRYSSLTQENS